MTCTRLEATAGRGKALARRAITAAIAMAAAACAGQSMYGPAISYNYVDSPYSPGEVGYAAGGRDLEVVVRGNPFAARGVSDAALDDAVIDAMDDQPGWLVTNYTTTPGETARGLYRVVWLFGVPANTSIYAICTDRYGAAVDAGGGSMMAAFCRGDKPLSYLGGTLADIETPDDRRFTGLVRIATRQLFPHFDPNKDDRDKNDLLN